MQVVAFLNSVLLLNQLNQVFMIATGINTCDCLRFDSNRGPTESEGREFVAEVGGVNG
ncbi:hypothetical protein RHGRI_029513 [Rhododendron griersonianum]|uniref:Uncharacterized protein n=1 Tax=Rhododendron griersonianum TaxID=479676 RepID=A0AAV6ILY1_9ERIC|nr:hypothetical protein RHGRI_029513 [Rhododendron griersonianum]